MPFRFKPILLMPVVVLVTAVFLLIPKNEAPTGIYQGYVEGEYVYISSGVGGRLESLTVARGQDVQQGALLYSLDAGQEAPAVHEAEQRVQQAKDKLQDLSKGQRPSELRAIEAQLRQAQSAYELAKDVHTRRASLFKGGTISREELDRAQTELSETAARVRQIRAELATARMGGREDAIRAAEADVQAAEAKLLQAKWLLDEKTQRAPAAAEVHDTMYRQGEWVPAGKPVVSLLPPQNIKVRFFVPEPVAGRISTGDKAEVRIDGVRGPFPMCVSYIADNAEYTPPVIYSSSQRAKLVFMLEAAPCAPAKEPNENASPADETVQPAAAHNNSTSAYPLSDSYVLRPGLPVDVFVPASLLPEQDVPASADQ
ncbi:HlyD family secretion protein [Oleidesulfovibrio sp.]|uniref:HlyD family secretion protein n=1 Tax=Oleidesulfovibrio sp. TaxID=2909707 RepID=UPI003A886C7B